MHIGYEANTGHVYEGANQPELPAVPPPLLSQAKLIERPQDLEALPTGVYGHPLAWVFREEHFDPVTRVRRGRLYEPYTSGQPDSVLTHWHPAEQLTMLQSGQSRVYRQLYRFWPCTQLLNQPRRGAGALLAIGQHAAWSTWRVVQVEQVLSGDVLVTLKALTAFGLLPEWRVEEIAEEHREPVRRALDRVIDSAFRETSVSIIDQCRNAAAVLIGRWLVSKDGRYSR